MPTYIHRNYWRFLTTCVIYVLTRELSGPSMKIKLTRKVSSSRFYGASFSKILRKIFLGSEILRKLPVYPF